MAARMAPGLLRLNLLDLLLPGCEAVVLVKVLGRRVLPGTLQECPVPAGWAFRGPVAW